MIELSAYARRKVSLFEDHVFLIKIFFQSEYNLESVVYNSLNMFSNLNYILQTNSSQWFEKPKQLLFQTNLRNILLLIFILTAFMLSRHCICATNLSRK